MVDGRARQQAARPISARAFPSGYIEWILELVECKHTIVRRFVGRDVTDDPRYANLASVPEFHGRRYSSIPTRAACDQCEWSGGINRKVPLARERR